MSFEHFILTRFSLSHFEGVEEANLDERYLDYRFTLFETFCLPSVKNQTCQNFKWLVLFDSNTPDRFKNRIEALHEEYPLLIPCFINLISEEKAAPFEKYSLLNDEYETTVKGFSKNKVQLEHERPSRLVLPSVIHRIINSLSGSPDFYVTSRLDNDDVLHKDYVSIIQQKVKENPRRVIFDFVNTFKFILEEGIVYQYPLENGHFITLVEPSDNLFQSVLFWNHLYASKFVETLHFYQRPIQLEIIHKTNVVNAFTELCVTGMVHGFVHFRTSDFGLTAAALSFKRYCIIFGSLVKKKICHLGSHSELLRRYFWPFPKFKREVIVFIDGPGHGGLTDRIRNILSVYFVCKEYAMPFRLFYTYPYDLSTFLSPNQYDWRITAKDISYHFLDSKTIYLWVDKIESDLRHQDWIKRRHLMTLREIATSKKRIQYHIHGNSYLAEGKYRSLFFELFRPASLLNDRLSEISCRLPADYEGVTFRFQNLLGDFKEYDFMPLPPDEQKVLINACINKIKNLHDCGFFCTEHILVTSDSVSFLKHACVLPYVHIIPGKTGHPDCNEKKDLDTDLKPFLDLFLLAKAKRITLLKTGKMYESGFPKFAAELGGIPYSIVHF